MSGHRKGSPVPGSLAAGIAGMLCWIVGAVSAGPVPGEVCLEVLVDDHLSGSGWFVTADGHAVTAAHVTGDPGRRIEVLTATGLRMRAHVVAVDLGHDLALLRTDAVPEEPFAVPELAETVPAPGTPVWVRGTCVYRHDVSLQGHVARSHTCYEWLPDRGHYVEVFLVAATAPKGMSGAPWIDGDGRVVGLQSGALAVGGSPLALAFAAPGRHLVRLIRERTTARTATIGVPVEELWEQGQDTLERFPPGTEGVVLRQVREDTAAGRAGLQEWDLVRGVDGERVRYRDELLVLVRARLPGETLALDVLGPDGAQPRRVDVELDCLEDAWLERGYP